MKVLRLSKFINGLPQEIERPDKPNLEPIENTKPCEDPDPYCFQYLSQIYKKETGHYLFKDSRKKSQPEYKEAKIKELLKEIKMHICRVKLYKSKLQPYLDNDDLDNLPQNKRKYLDWWRESSMKEFELYAKLKDLGVSDKDIYGKESK